KRASASNAYLDDVGYELLHMLRVTDYDGVFEKKIEDALDTDDNVLFVGLSPSKVQDIERALRPSTTSGFEPMIVLGDVFGDYGQHFGRTPFEEGSVPGRGVIVEQQLANGLWTPWWNDTRPARGRWRGRCARRSTARTSARSRTGSAALRRLRSSASPSGNCGPTTSS